jgi:hypothetical protein
VSWCEDIEAWLVASKNVSVVVRDFSDLERYPAKNIRYSFAALMAECWLNMLQTFSVKELNALKSDMHETTWIGEYIGNA